jgi:hypothetical protein
MKRKGKMKYEEEKESFDDRITPSATMGIDKKDKNVAKWRLIQGDSRAKSIRSAIQY